MATRRSNTVTTKTITPDVEPVVEQTVVEEEVIEAAPVVVKVAPLESPAEDGNTEVLVKMERQNWSYMTGPYLFSQEHPFAVVKKRDVERLIKVEGGFRIATETEVKEFYG